MRKKRAQRLGRRLGLSSCADDPGRRGLILLQIDALSYFALRASLNARYLPFLSRLVKKGAFRLHSYQTGLPATTPAFQTGLFYGRSDHVPGFRWFDRATQRVMNVKRPEDAAEVERVASRFSPGLLTGGGCHCSLVSGGAQTTSLVLSRLATGQDAPSPAPQGWGSLLVLALLQLWMIARMAFDSLVELGIEVFENLRAEYEGRMVRGLWPFLAVRVLTNVVFREIAARNVVLDIARGVPVIYANFAGYDELAHHRGPQSVSARLALRGIDARLREIFRAASRIADREYDVFVFSDHGQTPTVPFERLVGRTLEDELAAKLLDVRDLPLGVSDAEAARLRTLVGLHRELAQVLPQRLSFLLRHLASYIETQVPADPALEPYRGYSQVMLLPTSDLCHLYLTRTTAPVPIADLRVRLPELWRTLVQHPALWAVVGRGPVEDGVPLVEVANARGTAFVAPDGRRRVLGEDPFLAADFPEGIAAELNRFALSAAAGDAILIGAKVRGRAVNFQEELGGHGGPYIEEQTAFLISPPHVDFNFSGVHHHSELHGFFAARYGRS